MGPSGPTSLDLHPNLALTITAAPRGTAAIKQIRPIALCAEVLVPPSLSQSYDTDAVP